MSVRYLPDLRRNADRNSKRLWPKSDFYPTKFGAEEAGVQEAVHWKKTSLEVIEIGRVICNGLIVVKPLDLNRQGQVIL